MNCHQYLDDRDGSASARRSSELSFLITSRNTEHISQRLDIAFRVHPKVFLRVNKAPFPFFSDGILIYESSFSVFLGYTGESIASRTLNAHQIPLQTVNARKKFKTRRI